MSSNSNKGDKDVVILRQIPRGPYAPSLSPFPLKLETYLRMAKIPYKNVFGRKLSPKTGKTPWVQFNGQVLTDSQFIIEHLNKHFGIDTMSHLSPNSRGIARAFQKMIEENTYWAMSAEIFLGKSEVLQNLLPYKGLTLWVVSKVLRYKLQQQLWAQGIGRLGQEQAHHIGTQDLQALSAFLGEKKFITGDTPCEVDCAIFGMLAQIKWHMTDTPLLKSMDELPNLHDYCEVMKSTFWPDWNECITNGGGRIAEK